MWSRGKVLAAISARQMQTDAVESCNYCGRYGHSEAACYKKQAELSVYSEPVYGLLYSGAIPNVMSDTLAKKLRLQLSPTKRRIDVADG